MKILTRQQIGPVAWDTFCLAHPGAWFLWTSAYLDYQAARGTKELSFGIMDGDKLVAICPLFLEERGGVRSFTMEGHPGLWPLFAMWGDSREEMQQHLEAHALALVQVQDLSTQEDVRRAAFRLSPFDTCQIAGVTGWSDISWHTQIIDLAQSDVVLHAGIRKSYTSLINHVTRTHELVVDDKGDLLKAFQRLHFGQAGRQTRPDRTWEIQGEWCKSGNGLIVAAMRWNVAVACTYWICYKGCAYYASSASINPNVTHALIWKAMLELKARGIETLEMGWIDYDKTEKGQGIARFKQGFGGKAVPVIAVERRF
jgi:hypothetical protein